jgi:hypothetical protein
MSAGSYFPKFADDPVSPLPPDLRTKSWACSNVGAARRSFR